jgi:nucleoid DNA-binding protein
MKSKTVKKIIQNIAFETGVSMHEIELIVKSQFKVIPKIMATTEEPVRLPRFGIFGVKPHRKELLTAAVNGRKRKKEDGTV